MEFQWKQIKILGGKDFFLGWKMDEISTEDAILSIKKRCI